jgi:hypothetical protein
VTLLALTLLAVALADLVAGGLAGAPRSLRAALLGWLTAVAVLAAGIVWAGGSAFPPPLATAAAVLLLAAGWLLSRAPWSVSVRLRTALGWTGLAALGGAAALALRGAGGWPGAAAAPAGPSFPDLSSALGERPARLLLTLGILLFLSATANGIVRLTLALAGTELRRSEQRLRGGRFIGVLERWLIFGLAVAGEPTAAALIASAKSLLRFPELAVISRSTPLAGAAADGTEIDAVTEYLLLGSLLSWLLALAVVPVWLAS